MRNTALVWMLVLAAIALAGPASYAGGIDDAAAFDRLKSLAGTWNGYREGTGPVVDADPEVQRLGDALHEFRVTADGTIVIETMTDPARAREMVTVYYLEDDSLVLTHYCHAGNQPRMRFNSERSTPDKLVFEFESATGLKAHPQHVRTAELTFVDDDHLLSTWGAYDLDEPIGSNTFNLARAEPIEPAGR